MRKNLAGCRSHPHTHWVLVPAPLCHLLHLFAVPRTDLYCTVFIPCYSFPALLFSCTPPACAIACHAFWFWLQFCLCSRTTWILHLPFLPSTVHALSISHRLPLPSLTLIYHTVYLISLPPPSTFVGFLLIPACPLLYPWIPSI